MVPYNTFLCLHFNCHVNIEICSSSPAAQYLYKYMTKGPDHALVSAEEGDNSAPASHDEISDYEDMHSVEVKHTGNCLLIVLQKLCLQLKYSDFT